VTDGSRWACWSAPTRSATQWASRRWSPGRTTAPRARTSRTRRRRAPRP
jgi:hypothetical protein